MEKGILAVGYNKDKFAETQAEWLKYHVLIRMESTLPEAIQELSKNNISADSHFFWQYGLPRSP